MNANYKHGYLEIVLGPMYAGKTSHVMDLYRKYNFCRLNTLVINHELDQREGSESTLWSHDSTKIPCTEVKSLSSVLTEANILKYSVFIINEGQFFTDLSSTVLSLVNEHKKIVHVNGLDGDFKREKFGQLLDLIPHCDDVVKLKALCAVCRNGTKGLFTYRKSNEKQQVIIDTENMYIPVCRNCYNTMQKDKK